MLHLSFPCCESCLKQYYTLNAPCQAFIELGKYATISPIMNNAKYVIEIHDSRLTRMGLNAIIDFYRTLACREHQFPGAAAFVAGLDSPYFNTLFDTRMNRQNSASLVTAATNFFGEYQVPWGWFIMPADNHNDLADHDTSGVLP